MTSFLSSIGKKKRSPEQLVQAVKDSLQRLTGSSFASISNPADTENEKKLEEERNALLTTIGKALVDMKNILYGDHDSSAVPSSSNSGGTSTSLPLEEEKIRELSLQLQSDDALVHLIRSLAQISFESRKDTTQIFCHLLKKNIASFAQNLIQHHLSLIHFLIEGYGNAEIAFHCGIMIREAIKYADILRYILLTHPQHLVWPFIDRFLHLPNFDIASDGFNTFKEFFGASVSSSGPSGVGGSGLTPEQVSQHKQIINDFFDQHGADFLSKYEILLRSENYVTRRRSLKLLGELLLDRSHYSLMIRYVSSPTNLKTIMHLLRNRSPHITFETFHIFKIFVANPNKPPEIASILFNNKVKLIAYLENFQNDRTDVQFIEEKRLLIETLQQLADPYEHMEGGGRAEERGLFSRASSKREEMAPGNIVGDVERLSLTDSNHGERSSSVGDNSSNNTTRQIHPTDLISPPSQI